MLIDAYQDAYSDAYGGDAPEVVVGVYPLVYPWIARCLQDSASGLDDAYFDDPIRGTIRDRLGKLAPRAGYSTGAQLYAALAGEDLDRVSEAIGLIVAADWQPSLATGGAGGDLVSEGTEQVKRAFAPAAPLRTAWRSRAQRLLTDCAFSPPKVASPTIAGASGPTRRRVERLREYGYGLGCGERP